MNITVYLGANAGNEEIFSEAVCELGSWIGRSKNRLVYGGSKTGLMGRLAESVLRSQGDRSRSAVFYGTECADGRSDSVDRDQGYHGAEDENDRAG